MPSNTVISEKVRNTLDNKRKVMGRTNLDSDPYKSASKNKKSYLKNISRTPYTMMVSERMDRPTFEDTEGFETSTDEDVVATEAAKSLALTLSNQEFSNIDKKEVTYGTKSYNARGNRNRPTAGITGLTSEYISSGNVNFIKKATINWTCHSLEDLQVLSERFLTLSARVYVEFGWVLPGDKEKRAKFIDDAGNLDISVSEDNTFKTINTEIAKRVIEMGEGTFEAFIGRIENFSITSREDGGFDCTTELMANGIDILNAKTESNPETNVEIEENDILQKDLTKLSFQNAIRNLPSSMLRILKNDKNIEGVNIYEDLESAESVQEYESGEYYNTDTGEIQTEEEIKKDNEKWFWKKEGKYQRVSQIEYEGFKRETKKLYQDNNLVVINTGGFLASESSKLTQNINTTKLGKRSFNNREDIVLDPSECWIRWGWFEDNLLNRYFSLVSEVGANNEIAPEVYIRSREKTGKEDVLIKEINVWKDLPEADKKNFRSSGKYKGVNVKSVRDENTTTLKYETKEKVLGTDYESTKVKSNPAFKTTNFKEFIFPGKFKLEREQEKIKKERTEAREKIVKTNEEYAEAYLERTKLGGDDAKIPSEKELDLVRQQTEATNTLKSTYVNIAGVQTKMEDLTITEAKKIAKNNIISKENYNIKETGVVPLLIMTALETAFTEIAGEHSFEANNDEEGYLRNIFINVGLIQDIFSDGGATTLGENFNRLSEKLQQNSLGLIKLKAENDPSEPGNIKFNSVGFTKSDEDFIKKAKEDKSLYIFPVWQNDSIVISQAIGSDLNSELQKVEYIKDIQQQDLTKDGLSIYHQWNFNSGIPADSPVEENLDMRDKKRLRPIYLLDTENGTYFNYGQKEGNVDIPLSKDGPPLWEDGYNPIVATKDDKAKKDAEDEKKANEKSSTDADIQGEKGIANFLGFNTDGTMVADEIKNMKENINKGLKNGRPVTTQDEYGLIFISNTIQISGISGIKPGDIWTTNYLPKKFQERAHFWTTNVEHSLDSTGWTTTITGQMTWSLGRE